MGASVKTKPELVNASRSHWLELGGYSEQQAGEPFKREEVHPIVQLEVSRAGVVRAEFSADRYSSSDGIMGPWRVILRDIRKPAGDGSAFGDHAAGIGPGTRREISDACEPVIREWLESEGYRESRRRAAAYAVVREIGAPADYTIEAGRRALERTHGELLEVQASAIREALGLLQRAGELLEGVK